MTSFAIKPSGIRGLPAGTMLGNSSGSAAAATTMDVASIQSMLGIPGGNPFNQSLNTTDSPSFVAGDFSGTLTASNGVVVNAGRYVGLGYSSTKLSFATTSALLQVGTTTIFNAFTTQVQFYKSLVPNNTGSAGIGLDSKRWSGVFSQNGSFSSNLSVETGGSFKLFNLGETGDVNKEYLESSWNTNLASIQTKASGSGVVRDLQLGTSQTKVLIRPVSNQIWLYSNNNARILCSSGGIGTGGNVYPFADDTDSNGLANNRWSNFFAVDADISGTISAGDGSVTAPSYSFGSQSTMGIYRAAINQINMVAAANGFGFNMQPNSFSISRDMAYGWRSASNISQGHSYDTLLARDATGIIAQRNFFADAPQAFRIYGTWTDASNGEWLQMDHGVTHANIATISNQDNGTGTGRHLYIKAADQLRFYSGGNLLHWVHTATQAIFYKDAIRPHGTSDFGTTVDRWANGYFVDADISGTMTLSSYDDGAGNSGDVTTTPITSPTDSFWFDKNSVGTLSTGWVGLRTNYNASGTAHNWFALNNDTARLEIGNGLRAVWQLSGNMHRLNMNFNPYVDNSYYNGSHNGIWSEVWQGSAKIRGSFVDSSNYGYLSIEPDSDNYKFKINSLGTTAGGGFVFETSQLSAAGNEGFVFDVDYNGTISWYFGGNSRGYMNKNQAVFNLPVQTNTSFNINRTWNSASTVYESFVANITDTASDAESSLLDLKVGGTSYLRLRKNGDLLFEKNGGSAGIVQNAGGIAILGDNGSTVQSFDQYFNYTYKTFRPISDNQHLGYVSRRFLVKANDIYSKGKIRSYNLGDETAVDAEYLNLHWLSGHAYLTCEATGTGVAREFSIGTHTNGSIRFNDGTNMIRFSVAGATATKMYLNSSGLTLYGVMSPQGDLTRDIGAPTSRWRRTHTGVVNQQTNSTGDPSTSEYANDGDLGVHENTTSGAVFIVANVGGTIYKQALTA